MKNYITRMMNPAILASGGVTIGRRGAVAGDSDKRCNECKASKAREYHCARCGATCCKHTAQEPTSYGNCFCGCSSK